MRLFRFSLTLPTVSLLAFMMLAASISSAPAADIEMNQNHTLIAAADDDDDEVNDPLEPLNRAIFRFNEFVEALLLRPMAEFYHGIIPPPMRSAIGNILSNVSAPVVLANDLLQGEGDRAINTAGRFLVNTTVGIGGMLDVAEKLGMEEHDEDFGQTMGVWGVGEGLYLILPVFGPSNPRDAVGRFVVDWYIDPFNRWMRNTDREGVGYVRKGMSGVHSYSAVMEELDQVKRTSVDYYAAIRSMYRQRRNSEIRNGAAAELPPIPDLSLDPEETGPELSLDPEASNKL